MDILIDLIVYLIKLATDSRDSKAPTPQQSARQRAALDQQIRTMRQSGPGSKRVGPASKNRSLISRPPSLPAVAAPIVVPARATPSAGATPVVQRLFEPRPSKAALSMRLPFILGEVLSTPVALREPEL